MTSSHTDGKSIPIRYIIEVVNKDQNNSGKTVENENFAIVPSNTLFKDVVKTVLSKLGYNLHDMSNAKGAVQIKNWRALDLDQVTDNLLATVEDMLGDLTTVATLRIRISSTGRSEDVKDKFLLMLINQTYEALQKRGCPVPKDDLEKVVAGHGEFSVEAQTAFYNWYNKLPAQQSFPKPPEAFSAGLSAAQLCHRVVRNRISFDSEEVSRLQKWFDVDPHPSRQQMHTILNELNHLPTRSTLKPLELTNIMYWFKNARASARRNGRSITSDDLSEEEERQSDREEAIAIPTLPNKNAIYMIKDPLVNNNNAKDTNSLKESDMSDIEDDLSITDEDEEDMVQETIINKDLTDVKIEQKDEHEQRDNNKTRLASSSSSSSPNISSGFMNMGNRLPGYPGFPYTLPMAYLQSPMNPFYKDWSEKVQSLVGQTNSAQQNLNILKARSDSELSKAERQKRHRAFIDPVSEIPKLEQWFIKDTHPSHYVIEQICEDLNRGEFRSRYPKLSPKNIQLWFKNHRAKVKRMRVGGGALSLSFRDMSSPPMSPPPSGLALSMVE